jgi:hypothetical protein
MKIFYPLMFLFLALSAVSSCGNKKIKAPDYVVRQDSLVSLLVDIHLTDAMLNKEKKPHAEKYEEALKLYPAVFLKHNIDRAVFDSTIKFYVKYPEQFSKIYDDVLRELSILEGSLQQSPDLEEDDYE